MTITNAFKELISDNTDWYRTTELNRTDAELLRVAFITKGEQKDAIKKLLSKAGYIVTENWSKSTSEGPHKINNNKFIHPENKLVVKPGMSDSEIDLIKQANNPLGDPNKI